MPQTNVAKASLVGRSFDCDFGQFVPRLTFHSTDEMRVQALLGATQIDEVVHIDITDVRPNLVLVNWTEEGGNFVVQLQDHENAVVHNFARLADGQIFCAQGAIQPV